MERYLLHAVDRYWHHGCLKCSACGTTLADVGGSCFTRDGMTLCKHDYLRFDICTIFWSPHFQHEFSLLKTTCNMYVVMCVQLVPGSGFPHIM